MVATRLAIETQMYKFIANIQRWILRRKLKHNKIQKADCTSLCPHIYNIVQTALVEWGYPLEQTLSCVFMDFQYLFQMIFFFQKLCYNWYSVF